jgi:hypothetical protein
VEIVVKRWQAIQDPGRRPAAGWAALSANLGPELLALRCQLRGRDLGRLCSLCLSLFAFRSFAHYLLSDSSGQHASGNR